MVYAIERKTISSAFVPICLFASAVAVVLVMSQLALVAVSKPNSKTKGAMSAHQLRQILSDMDPDLMGALPNSFLSSYKTPCWHRKPGSTAQQAEHAALAGVVSSTELQQQQQQQGHRRRQQELAEQQQQQQQHQGQQLWHGEQLARTQKQLLVDDSEQLQCLPYFHILGAFQSGAFSLYRMLEKHPEVATGHNPRPHFWAEHDKSVSTYMNELQGALPFIKQQPDKAVLGDASESTFAFYMSAGMRGHRTWLKTLQPCRERCGNLQDSFKQRCMDVCFSNATRAGIKYADRFKMARRHLDTALLLKAAYSGRGAQPGVPKLIVVLREPRDRLLSAFLEYEHYRIRYGNGSAGFLAFVKDQLAAFRNCLDKHGSLEECVLLFESLDYANEQVFFHCDQLLRGIYWVYLASWQRHFGSDLMVLLSEELFSDPQGVLLTVVKFLGLSGDLPESTWTAMQQVGGYRQSLVEQHNYYYEEPEADRLVREFYAVHNTHLGEMLSGEPTDPWVRFAVQANTTRSLGGG